MTAVTLANGETLFIENSPLGRGATGSVFAVKDNANLVVKLYHQPNPTLGDKLNQIITSYNCTHDSSPQRQQYWSSLYCWPQAVVVAPKIGLVLPRYGKNLVSLFHLFAKKAHKALPRSAKEWNRRVFFAWRLTQAISRLHRSGLAHSDLSPNNILVDPSGTELTVIDLDGLVIPDYLAANVIGTPGYIAPELQVENPNPNIKTDRFSLAIMIYQLLLGRHPLLGPYDFGLDPYDNDAIEQKQLGNSAIFIEHPLDPRNRPEKYYPSAMLGDSFVSLFEQAFVQGINSPDRRPTAESFKVALGRLLDRLVTCHNTGCVDKYYPVLPGKIATCPWCNTPLKLQGGIPAIRLYEPGPRGPILLDDFWVAGYPGRSLYAWHCARGAEPDPLWPQHPMLTIRTSGASWYFENNALDGLVEVFDNGQIERPTPPSSRVEIKDGSIFRLGPPPDSRYVLVQWIK